MCILIDCKFKYKDCYIQVTYILDIMYDCLSKCYFIECHLYPVNDTS